jgi:hypothetical protein
MQMDNFKSVFAKAQDKKVLSSGLTGNKTNKLS